jgi:flagellar basal-body rod protein FlgG
MIRGFYTAGSGLVSQQAALDNTANNIANLSTTGFKKRDLSFSELLSSTIGAAGGTQPQNIKVGNGSKGAVISSSFTQGSLQFTGSERDFAIMSKGFFAVQTSDGSVKYTRDGSFSVSSEEDGNYLVNSDGNYVLDKEGNKLSANEPDYKDKIGVYDFSNPYGLYNAGNNLFDKTAQSGQPEIIEGKLRPGCIELSNVELSCEMTDLLEIQRAYQFDAKFIQTADEIESIANNLK